MGEAGSETGVKKILGEVCDASLQLEIGIAELAVDLLESPSAQERKKTVLHREPTVFHREPP